MLRNRAVTILVAAVIGAVFLTGLFVHGWVGALLVAAVAAVLLALSRLAWETIPPPGRRLRLVVATVVLAIAAVKLATGH